MDNVGESKNLSLDLKKSDTQWSLKEKLGRGLWLIVQSTLFRLTPKRLGNKWRCFLLKLFGATINGEILVSASCKILRPWDLEINDGSAIGESAIIYNYARVTIGAMSVISQYSYLCTGTHDYTHPHYPLIWAPITIGSQCWVAAKVFIAPGVTIGDGTVIGACSVVTRDMPSWTVCAGNPCRPIKPRVIRKI